MGADKIGKRRVDESRDPGQFVALPTSVLDSLAYLQLSHPARSLLIEIARQYNRTNNGRLITTLAYLRTRGWTSSETITRAKRELLAAGLIYETFKGHRPNKASWYALTFHALYQHAGFDPGAYEFFHRGAYRKNTPLKPSRAAGRLSIAPSHEAGQPATAPAYGAIKGHKPFTPAPSGEHHLEKPSLPH